MDLKKRKDLYYVCGWEKDRKNSWSGTHYSLYSALTKYADTADIDVGYFQNNATRILHYFDKALYYLSDNDETLLKRYYARKYSDLWNKTYSADAILFNEYLQFHDSRVHQYIYIDVSVDYACRLIQDDYPLFQISGLNCRSMKYFKQRRDKQNSLFKNCSGVLCMGHWMQKDIQESGVCDPDKVYCVGGGYNIPIDRIDEQDRTGNKILFVGKDFTRKNGPLVIEAFKRAKAEMPQLELYIAGPEQPVASEEEQKKYNIHCLGLLDFNALADYFNKCDVFCMPSRFEAYGLVFAEALVFGLPCIGSDRYEMPYFIEDGKTGYLLRQDDPDELADLMVKAVQNKKMREDVKSCRQEYLTEYSWDSVAKRIIQIMKSN